MNPSELERLLALPASDIAEAAWAAVDAGQREDAMELLEAATHRPDAAPGLSHNLGILYAEAGDPRRAIRNYTKAIKGGYRQSFVNRALAYETIGLPGNARADYRSAIETDPDDAAALIDLGMLELKEGSATTAIAWLRRAVSLDSRANWQLADALKAEGLDDEAKEALVAAVEAGELRANLDLALDEIGVLPNAAVEQRFRAAIDGGSIAAIHAYSDWLQDLGRSSDAESILRAGIAEGVQYLHGPLGELLERRGDVHEAAVSFQLAVREGDIDYAADAQRLTPGQEQ